MVGRAIKHYGNGDSESLKKREERNLEGESKLRSKENVPRKEKNSDYKI